MRKLTLLTVIICALMGLNAQIKKKVELDDIWKKGTFRSESVYAMTFLNDGNYADLLAGQIIKYSLKTRKPLKVLFDAQQYLVDGKPLTIQGYSFNGDESLIMLETATEKVYRHSYWSDNYIFDIKAQKLVRLSEAGKQMYAHFSPDGKMVAFVRANNIYVRHLKSGQEQAITQDGEWNKIINGAGDWVYEEEFVLTRAFEWSSDASKLAYVKFDESAVRQLDMAMYQGLYSSNYSFKYPKAGEDNSKVSVHVYDLNTKKTDEVDLGGSNNYYVPRIQWTNKSNELSVQKMNRHQNHLDILVYNTDDGSSKIIMKEQNPYYIDVNDYTTFLKDGNSFIWLSERDSFNHIYKVSKETGLAQQLTKGNWDVTDFYGIDEKKSIIYFQSSQVSATDRYVYAYNYKTHTKTQLTKLNGTNNALFNKNFTYFINYQSSLNQPVRVSLYTSKGKELNVLVDNAKLKKKLEDYQLGNYEFIRVPGADGTMLNGKIMKPIDFDSTQQYPVFMYVYGGPGSQTVNNAWGYSDYFWYCHLASLGYIVVSIDNRGTGARGQEFKKCTYMELGKKESDDQIAAAKYLGALNYVDASRIGIFGWSYGGYMSSLCLFKGNDVFKMAIAVAPVTNWKFYDTIYTERYMRTPQENKKGYFENDPIFYADSLKGNYLLIHGTADDNVHFHNSVELVEVLIQKDKQFETMYYPNKNHSIYGGNTRYHLYTLMTNFIKENL